MTKGPAVVTKRQAVATPRIFGRSSSWMRSRIAALDHVGEVEAIERQCCDVQQDPVEPHKAWVGLSLFKACLGAELSNAPSTKNLCQRPGRCLARGRSQKAPEVPGDIFGHSCRQALA